jgi:hypothetical protein
MDERLVADQIRRGSTFEDRESRAGNQAAVRRHALVGGAPRRVELPRTFGPEEYIIGWLLLRPDLLAGLDEEMISQQAPPLGPDDLSSAENRALLEAVLAQPGKMGGDVGPEDRLADLPEPLRAGGQAAANQVRLRPPLTDEKLIKDLGDSLLRIRERNLKRQVQQLEFLIRESSEAEDRDESRRLHEVMAAYTTQKRYIQKLLTNRSIAGVLAQRKPIGEG